MPATSVTSPPEHVLIKLAAIACYASVLLGRDVNGLLLGWTGGLVYKNGRPVKNMQEYINERLGRLDKIAIEKLVNDPEVKAWLRQLESVGLVPRRAE